MVNFQSESFARDKSFFKRVPKAHASRSHFGKAISTDQLTMILLILMLSPLGNGNKISSNRTGKYTTRECLLLVEL